MKDLEHILRKGEFYFAQEYQDSNIFIVNNENICNITQLELALNFQTPRDTEDEEIEQ